MGRTVTVRNPNHPKNVMHDIGQRTKNHVRTLSNIQLDVYLTDAVEDKEFLKRVLLLSHSKKIEFVKTAAMSGFINEYEKEKAKEAEDHE